MMGSSSGDEIRKVIDVRNATPDFNIPASTGSVEQEQNGVIAPSSSPLSGPGRRPSAIQLWIRSGPNRRFTSATSTEISENRTSNSTRINPKVCTA